MSLVDPELRAMLVCPSCRGELEDRPGGLFCPSEQRLYPVVDGVPYLVQELAKKVRKSR
ncbi:MAG: hypothetical protein ACI8PZ_005889 [Myxococcota bacterium]|jgi:uncharacterized protein YbaR (Trm112 family)